jgi:hypothetical protein
VPPGLRNVAKKQHKKRDHGPDGNQNGHPGQGGGNPPNPFPTFSCDPAVVTCGGPVGTGQTVNATPAAAAAGIFAGLPATCLWVRRRRRRNQMPQSAPEASERQSRG